MAVGGQTGDRITHCLDDRLLFDASDQTCTRTCVPHMTTDATSVRTIRFELNQFKDLSGL